MLIMFNPRSQTGEVHRMERDRMANVVELSAFGHPNVITGEDVIPGAVTREQTVRRINMWTIPTGEGEQIDRDCFEVPEFLVGAVSHRNDGTPFAPLQGGYRRIMNPAFSYMVLGQYPSQAENQLISREWINAARTRWDVYVAQHGMVPPIGVRPVIGQDIGELGSDDSVSCIRYGGFVSKVRTWRGVDPLVSTENAADIYNEVNAYAINIDSTGVGSSVAPGLVKKKCNARRVMVGGGPTKKIEIGDFNCLRDQLWWQCREWLRTDPTSMLPPDVAMIEELAVPTYWSDKRTRKIRVTNKDDMKEVLGGRSPDRADALCLTFYEGDTLIDSTELDECFK